MRSVFNYLQGRAILSALLAALLLSGCGEEEAKSAAPAGPHKVYNAGLCILTVATSAPSITLAQTLRLTLTTEHPENWDVQLPELKDKLGDFAIEQSRPGDPQLLADGKTVRQTLTLALVPALAGTYTIPPLEVAFTQNAPSTPHSADKTGNAGSPANAATNGATSATSAKERIRTEALTITVTSVIPAGEKDPALRDISGPHGLPDHAALLHGILIGAAAAAVLAVLVYLLVRHLRRQTAPEVLLSPQERALRELERLLREDCIATGRHKEFYLGLSDLLRRYIEERFSLAAPERTTEEFLEELRAQPVLSEQHTHLLKDFLRHCDLVKFARHQPVRTEIGASAASCRRFIEETPSQPPQPPEPERSVRPATGAAHLS